MIRTPEDTPDLADRVTLATGHLRHNGDCDYPNPIATVGSLGDEMVRCWTCGRFVVLAAAGSLLSPPEPLPTPEPTPAPIVAVAAVVGGWRCAEHLRVVTWRGRGCRSCADERDHREREREKAARARREALSRRDRAGVR